MSNEQAAENKTNRVQPEEEKKWYTVTDLREYNLTAPPFLWEPYFPIPSLVGITGPSDTGKSTLMKQLALAIVDKEQTFLGSQLNVTHGKVCYLATEDEQVSTWRVLSKQIEGRGPSTADDSLVFVFDYENLESYLQKNADTLDCVIVDTLADTFLGNPNNLVDVRGNLRRYSDLARKHRLCVIMVHHNVKYSDKTNPDKNKMNGSQALEARLRCVLELRLREGHPNERLLTAIKCNHLPQEQKGIPIILELDQEHLTLSKVGFDSFVPPVSGGKHQKYKALWLERMVQRKALGDSFKAAVEYFKQELLNEDVPSETWFKENYKDFVGQSDTKEDARPTETNPLADALSKI